VVLIKGDRKGGVCRKNELGVSLPPVPMIIMREGRRCYREDVSLYASDVNGSRYGSLINGHCLEILGGSEGEVGGCTYSYSAAVDANNARVNANDRMMTNLKRVTLCDCVTVCVSLFDTVPDNLGCLPNC